MGEGTPRHLHFFLVSWSLFVDCGFGAEAREPWEGAHPAQGEQESAKNRFILGR